MGSRQIRYGQSLAAVVLSATQIERSRRAERAVGGRKQVPSNRCRSMMPLVLALFASLLLFGGSALGSVTASITGTVTDPSGAALVGATVTATNVETGIAQTLHTNQQGYFTFPSLALGHYDVEVQQSGFRPFHETGLLLDVNSALTVDVVMKVGDVKEAVTVSSTAVHVETSTTQLGEVISGNEMTSVPLVSRSYTDLLALQPGVSSASSGIGGGGGGVASGSNFVAAGFSVTPVSGSLNAGNLSVNGMREANNGFLLNGAVVQEAGFGGTAVIPNLDSIAEFRIITNNFDAEYGNYSGGQINVITKSGTNGYHGDLFEFLRNTNLDARGYLDPARAAYHQNQFGGTFGGPIKRDKLFFFADYQGNRVVQGVSTGHIPVPTTAEVGGDFSIPAASDAFATLQTLPGVTGHVPVPKLVNGSYWATQLQAAFNNPNITAGVTPYYYQATDYNPLTNAPYGVDCTTSAQCVFLGGQIPTIAFSSISNNLLKYIPITDSGVFSTSANSQRIRDDKTSGRVDANSHFGMISGYYFFDQYTLSNPYTPASSVPGFGSLGTGRAQVINLGDTKAFGNSSVNEFRVQFVRTRNVTNPSGGVGVTTLNQLGITGVTPLDPSVQGVPEIDLNSFQFGTLSRIFGLTENTYQILDNYRRVVGKHTLSFGGSYHYTQLQEKLRNIENGNYQFFGGETGLDFADFVLGAPTSFLQGQTPASNGRSKYMGLFGQDSWRTTSNLTLNYGLRWEFATPWYEQHDELETIVPGLQSKVFPNSPTGWVFPGDPGIPRTLAPTRYNNFAPRLGLAYSPSRGNGWLGKLFGAGQTSIRAGYGLFYTSFEGATDFNEIGDAPYGDFYGTPFPPTFANPYLSRVDGVTTHTSPFPIQLPVPQNFDFAGLGYLPIGSSPGFYYKNRLPYAEQYELSIQRQFSSSTLLTLSYVGTQAHRLLSTQEANPGNPALCLDLAAAGATQVGNFPTTCGAGGENATYVLPPGIAAPTEAVTAGLVTTGTCASGSGTCNEVVGTRGTFPFTKSTGLPPNLTTGAVNFTSNGYFITNGTSAYNSVQINLRHTAKALTFLAGYTFSKSLDDSSAYGEQVNPFNPKLSRGLSAFDQTHNFVFSYSYNLPFDKLGGPKRLTNGWQLSGITRFATGVPVIMYETDDNSLLGTAFAGPLPIGMDVPIFTGTSIHRLDPRATGNYFDASQFTAEPIGTLGTQRRFFHGPGQNDWDMTVLKNTRLTETMKLEIRADFYNLFNHTQFNAVNGNFSSSTFGSVLSTQQPRIGQVSLKLLF